MPESNTTTADPAAANPAQLQDISDDRPRQRALLLLDVVMVALVLINLTWIIFDSLFALAPVSGLLASIVPRFEAFYRVTIHPNFVLYDLAFVAVFFAEFLFSWALAIVNRTYHRWFFYPVIHWYDLLGCIPLTEFRFFRVLRVFAIAWRLQRVGLINLREWEIGRFVSTYYDVVVEEVSDRVVANVLEGVKDELTHGRAIETRLVDDVLRPRSRELASVISGRLQQAIGAGYGDNREQLLTRLRDIVGSAVERNRTVHNIERVPVLGSYVQRTLEEAIVDIVTTAVDDAANAISGDGARTVLEAVVGDAVEGLLVADGQSDAQLVPLLTDIIDILIEQVSYQRWKDKI